MKYLKYIFAMLVIPVGALAHVKWFIDSKEVVALNHGSTPFYYLSSGEVWIWSGVAVLVVLLFSALDRLHYRPKKLSHFAESKEKGITWIVQALVGLFLIVITVAWKIILVPDFLITTEAYTQVLAVFQLLAGILLILNFRIKIASLLILILVASLGLREGIVSMFENAMMIGLALYFFIKAEKIEDRNKAFDMYSVEILRVTVGITLITLAFTEKLMYPELGLGFLDIHNWNFMQMAGFTWFTDDLFVLSTGFAELIFGVIFILGYLTRVNTIFIALFFAMSVVTMSLQFGQWEVEDLPVYATAIVFLMYGSGKTRFFHKIHPAKYKDTIFD